MSPLGLRKRFFAKKSAAGNSKAVQKPAPSEILEASKQVDLVPTSEEVKVCG